MIRCVIVDDEPMAREILKVYVSNNQDLELVASCKNAKETLAVLQTERVDLLFLDIQMPDITGMKLAKSLENPPLIVFTTAYDKYAVEGYEVNAIDYLLKPIAPDRFNKAVEKVKTFIELTKKNGDDNDDFMFVRADYQDVKIRFADILYIEGLKDYVKIVTPEKKIITLTNIKGMLSRLPQEQFVRIHKSYIVSLAKVESIKGNEVCIAGKTIPIGQTFKDDFRKMMNISD